MTATEGHDPGALLKATIEVQADELARLLADDSAAEAARRLADASRIFVVGTGTSYHGALVGQFMLRSAGREAWAVRAFEFANYPPAVRSGDGLILLTHRGTKRFSLESLDAFTGSNERWIAIAGLGAPIEGDGVVRTVEQERSPVHTASHTTALLRLAQIASRLGSPRWHGQLADLPGAVVAAIGLRGEVATALAGMNLAEPVYFVGGGPGRATAFEGALKIREAAHVVSAEGHDVEGILHGPLVSVQAGQSAVVLAQPGPALERTREVAQALTEIGAAVVAVGPEAGAIAAATRIVTPGLEEELAPIANVVPLQWLAYEAARRVGVDADSFRRDEPRYAEAQKKYVL